MVNTHSLPTARRLRAEDIKTLVETAGSDTLVLAISKQDTGYRYYWHAGEDLNLAEILGCLEMLKQSALEGQMDP